jgi:hypothetical protein
MILLRRQKAKNMLRNGCFIDKENLMKVEAFASYFVVFFLPTCCVDIHDIDFRSSIDPGWIIQSISWD